MSPFVAFSTESRLFSTHSSYLMFVRFVTVAMRNVLRVRAVGRLRDLDRHVLVVGLAQNLPIVVAGLDVLPIDGEHVVAVRDVDPVLVGRTVAIDVRHAILAVRRLELESQIARRVRARDVDARRAAHAGVRRVQLADHRVRDVVDVFVRARVLEERRVLVVDRRPVLAVHVRVVVAVLHDAIRLVEDLLPFFAPVDAHGEREADRFARGCRRLPAARRAGATSVTTADRRARTDRQTLDRAADATAAATTTASRRAHRRQPRQGSTPCDDPPSAPCRRTCPLRCAGGRVRRCSSEYRPFCDASAAAATTTAASTAAAESTAAYRVVDRAPVARQEIAAHGTPPRVSCTARRSMSFMSTVMPLDAIVTESALPRHRDRRPSRDADAHAPADRSDLPSCARATRRTIDSRRRLGSTRR